jgi:non-heme chloroperoxidase
MPFFTAADGADVFYKELPHGCHSTHPDLINADIFGFIRGEQIDDPVAAAPSIIAEPIPVG